MKAVLLQLVHSLRKSLQDLTPIILVIGFFQLVVLRQPVPQLGEILLGGLMVLLGLSLFVQGLQMALFPAAGTLAGPFAERLVP